MRSRVDRQAVPGVPECHLPGLRRPHENADIIGRSLFDTSVPTGVAWGKCPGTSEIGRGRLGSFRKLSVLTRHTDPGTICESLLIWAMVDPLP